MRNANPALLCVFALVPRLARFELRMLAAVPYLP